MVEKFIESGLSKTIVFGYRIDREFLLGQKLSL